MRHLAISRLSALFVVVCLAVVAALPSLPSSGATTSVMLVKDIVPGASDSLPTQLTDVGGTLFFAAQDLNGRELWKSDGTDAGTVMVKDISSGGHSNPTELLDVGGTLFFSADDRSNGVELWKSDGTEAGTVLVKDINPSGDSFPQQLTAVNGIALFTADDGVSGRELWRSDGTEAGTVLVKDILANTANGNPQHLTTLGDAVFFSATTGGLDTGNELWRSDGTEAGTVLVRDIQPGGGSSNPANLLVVGSTLYFAANDGATGIELWSSDGTEGGTALVRDIDSSFTSSFPSELTDVAGTLFFAATDATNWRELWKSDGTEAGTVMVSDINPNPFGARTEGSFPRHLLDVAGTMFFQANDGTNGEELWKSDGTAAGTVLVKDIEPGGELMSSEPVTLFADQGLLYFAAITNPTFGGSGAELWTSDGTESGTVLAADINPGAGSSMPGQFTRVGESIFFVATDDTVGSELRTLETVPDIITLTVTEHIGVADGAAAGGRSFPTLGETLRVTEQVTASAAPELDAVEVLSVLDQVTALVAPELSADESIRIGDVVTAAVTTSTWSKAIITVSGAPITRIATGMEIRVEGAGFRSNAPVEIVLLSDPVVLGTTTSAADGSIAALVSVPDGIPEGAHTVVASGANPAGGIHEARAAVVVEQAEPDPPPASTTPRPVSTTPPQLPTTLPPAPTAAATTSPSVDPSADWDGNLPSTGGGFGSMVSIALWMMGAGVVIAAGARRRRDPTTRS